MLVFPKCKINLGLYVTNKRPDGYHDIETCFYPVPWCDILEVIPSSKFTFTSSGIEVPGDQQENIVVKAYHLIKSLHNISEVKIHLHKVIPHGAGLGGGSSDAACMLIMLDSIFNLKLSQETLQGYALELGSDCPFFIQSNPVIAKGRGEVFSPIDLDLGGIYLTLIKPPISVSTAAAYKGIVPTKPDHDLTGVLKDNISAWKKTLLNDFEKNVFVDNPYLKEIKEKLYSIGAEYASMSGSGSSVFGMSINPIVIKNEFKDCIVWQGKL